MLNFGQWKVLEDISTNLHQIKIIFKTIEPFTFYQKKKTGKKLLEE